MSMFSEIAIEGTISNITRELKKKYDAEQNADRKYAYKQSILECLNHFDWDTPVWARNLQTQLNLP